MSYDQFQGILQKMLSRLNKIEHHLQCQTCGGDVGITTAGSGDVPAGLQSFTVTKTSSGGTVNITMSDGSVYPLTVLGETFSQSASAGGRFPDYTIASSDGGTWKWHGIK